MQIRDTTGLSVKYQAMQREIKQKAQKEAKERRQHRAPYRETKRLKAPERRALIVQAAQSILLEQGFAALTVRSAAEAAEIRMATLQYYFPTREQLFEAAFQDVADRAWAEVIEKLSRSDTSGAEKRLREFVHAMCASSQNESLVGFFI